MKKLSKLLALVMALAMILSLSITAFAASINIDGVKKGETYTAYQLLNYSAADTDGDGVNDAFSYYLTAAQYDADSDGNAKDGSLGEILETAGFVFEKSSDGTRYTVTNAASLTADGIVTVLNTDAVKTALNTKAISKVTETATADGTIAITSLATGYYFIDSSLGSLCELKSYDDQEVILEKNSVPQVDKKQSAASDGTYADDLLDLNIGDKVYYQVKITDGKGTNLAIVLKDTLTDGLTLDTASIVVYKDSVADGNELTVDTDYTVDSVDTDGFTLTLKDTYVTNLSEGAEVYVCYSATVDTDAVIDNATGNSNTAKITYSSQEMSDVVYVATYDMTLKKTDGTTALAGAKFKLYDAETDGNEIKLAKDATGYYVSADGTEEIDAGDGTGVNIRGLEPGTYWLEETAAPDGYNQLKTRTSVTIATGATNAVEINVVNHKGTELPSTGGIGTTIFYVVGSVLVIGAAVLLVTKKRMSVNG